MRAAEIVRDFLEWRWAPCVALTAGALAYVGLAVLIIPSQIDGGSTTSERAARFDSSVALPNTAFAASLTQSSFGAATPAAREARRSPAPAIAANESAGAARRGFSPPLEQPDPPPPPPPPPVQVPTPPPQPESNVAQPAPSLEQPAPAPPAVGDDSPQQQPQPPQQPQ